MNVGTVLTYRDRAILVFFEHDQVIKRKWILSQEREKTAFSNISIYNKVLHFSPPIKMISLSQGIFLCSFKRVCIYLVHNIAGSILKKLSFSEVHY